MLKLHIPFTEDSWHGYKRLNFKVGNYDAWVALPHIAAEGNPWSWCMEFPDAFTERCAALRLLHHGYHHAHIVVGNTYGCPEAQKAFWEFYNLLVTGGLTRKAVLIGLSRGGLYVYRFAGYHPEAVSVIYGDAPVCDFKSWPGGKGKGEGSPDDWARLLKYYGFANEQEAMDYKENPIDMVPILAKNNISIVHVVGDVDTVVPFEENTAVLQKKFEELGGNIQVYHKRDCGHHPHGLEDDTPVIDFILRNNRYLTK